MASENDRREGNVVHAGPRPAAGFHRRALRRRPGRDARRHRRARRRSAQGQPAAAGRARDRSLGAGRPFRHQQRAGAEREPRVPPQSRALRVPALGPDRVPQFSRGAARDRHRAPGQHRVSRPRRLPRGSRRHGGRLSRYGVRHRLAHDDGQRPWRRRMGCRRHRGRSGDARPAELDADPAGPGLSPDGQAARRRDRDRPGADDHRSAPQARRGREVRRVLWTGAGAPHHRRPRHARQHVSRVRRHRGDFPHRRHDARVLAPHGARRKAGRARRGIRQGPGAVPDGAVAGRHLHRDGGARSRYRGAQPRRTAAPAGSRAVDQGQGLVRRRARGSQEGREGRGVRWRNRRCHRDAARTWLRRDRRDHELHQHVEPERHDRRGSRRQEGGRARVDAQAVGQDQPRAGVEGGDRLLEEGRPRHLSRSDRLQPGRLRLHHVHRQQRPAARRGLDGNRGARPGGGVGAQRQPQLRGPHPAGSARQLPGVAAARRGVCAGGVDDDRHHDRAARHRHERQVRVSERCLADAGRDPGDDAACGDVGGVPQAICERVRRRRAVADAARARSAIALRGTTRPPTSASRRSSRTCR